MKCDTIERFIYETTNKTQANGTRKYEKNTVMLELSAKSACFMSVVWCTSLSEGVLITRIPPLWCGFPWNIASTYTHLLWKFFPKDLKSQLHLKYHFHLESSSLSFNHELESNTWFPSWKSLPGLIILSWYCLVCSLYGREFS